MVNKEITEKSNRYKGTMILKLEDGRTKEEAGAELFQTIVIDAFIRRAIRSQRAGDFGPGGDCLKNVRYSPPWGEPEG